MCQKLFSCCAFAVVILFATQGFSQKPKQAFSKTPVMLKVALDKEFNLGKITLSATKQDDATEARSGLAVNLWAGKKSEKENSNIEFGVVEKKSLKDITDGASFCKFEKFDSKRAIKFRQVILLKDGEECVALTALRIESNKLVIQYKPLSATASIPQLVCQGTLRVPMGFFNVNGIPTGWSFNRTSPERGPINILTAHENVPGIGEIKLQWATMSIGSNKHLSDIASPAEFKSALTTTDLQAARNSVARVTGFMMTPGNAIGTTPVGSDVLILLKNGNRIAVLELKEAIGNMLTIDYKGWVESAK
jgi:hypothetical protein